MKREPQKLARDRFKVGQRVRGADWTLLPWSPGGHRKLRGTVTGFCRDQWLVKVRVDGRRTAVPFHCDQWEPEP
jgi:hypothetical protein